MPRVQLTTSVQRIVIKTDLLLFIHHTIRAHSYNPDELQKSQVAKNTNTLHTKKFTSAKLTFKAGDTKIGNHHMRHYVNFGFSLLNSSRTEGRLVETEI